MKVLLIPVDAPLQLLEIEFESTFQLLGRFQELVGGDIQAVVLRGQLPGTLYCNENGKLRSPPLPLNPVASHFSYLMRDDYIVGDAFIASGPDEEGYDTDVDPHVVELIAATMGVPLPELAS